MTPVAASGGWTPPALDVPAAPAPEPLSAAYAVAFAALLFLGVLLLTVEALRTLRLYVETSDGVVEKRWPVPGFRWGGLMRRGVDDAAKHSRERGEPG